MAIDDPVIQSLRGSLLSQYRFYIIGELGEILPGYKPVVLTASSDRNQPGGWPDWSFRFTDPIEEQFQGTLNDWTSGRITIYSTNRVFLQPLRGPFNMGTLGRLVEITTEFRGTFEDFFMQAYTNGGDLTEDPLNGFIDFRVAPNTATGTLGSAWSRQYISFYPPKNARYMVPNAEMGSWANGKIQYFDAFQIEPRPPASNGASTWKKPRMLSIKVVPTRKNWSTASSFEAGAGNTSYNGGILAQVSADFSYQGSTSLKVSGLGGNTGGVRETDFVDVTPGEYLAFSEYVYVPARMAGPATMSIQFYKEDGVTAVGSLMRSTDVIQEPTQFTWARVGMVVQVPEFASKARMTNFAGQAVLTGTQCYIDGVLIEKSNVIGSFFNGDTAGADYLWKQTGTPGLTQSYYYQDRVKRNYILKRVLSENVPLGVAVADPEYALV